METTGSTPLRVSNSRHHPARQVKPQRQLKGLLKGNFELRSTRNGTRVFTKEMADFSTIRSDFERNNLP
jgi:hypothetical protein